jgi:hypothetical protein
MGNPLGRSSALARIRLTADLCLRPGPAMTVVRHFLTSRVISDVPRSGRSDGEPRPFKTYLSAAARAARSQTFVGRSCRP